MTDILSTIAAKAAERVEKRKMQLPQDLMQGAVKRMVDKKADFPFEAALRKGGISMICEVKKASPSKGILDDEFPYLQIAAEYEKAGADAISVLTEPDWFLGSDRQLTEIRQSVNVPILRKDFTVDSYQIYEAKLIGADAILFICALLDLPRLKEYIDIAHGLGLSAVVEAHDEEEVRAALEAGARIIGVNNRDLKTFQVDLDTSIRLRSMVPDDILYISESGIKSPNDIKKLREHQVDAVLIGETLMKSSEKKKLIADLRG
jgi:indole-3-glycerol phosphate synthase